MENRERLENKLDILNERFKSLRKKLQNSFLYEEYKHLEESERIKIIEEEEKKYEEEFAFRSELERYNKELLIKLIITMEKSKDELKEKCKELKKEKTMLHAENINLKNENEIYRNIIKKHNIYF